MYVDNCVTSVDTRTEYDEFKAVSVSLLQEARMELREWESTLEDSEARKTTPNDCITLVLGYK